MASNPSFRLRNDDLVKEAIAVLKRGGVVVFPTETAYGLAADPKKPAAVQKIYRIKGREKGKPLPLIAADEKMAQTFASISPRLMKLARKHWPGPLTVVGKKAAVRVSSHPVARALSRGLKRPIISTSANFSGSPACYSVSAVRKQFAGRKHQPDLYLDVGVLPRRKPSTIVAEKNGEVVVLRQGSVKI